MVLNQRDEATINFEIAVLSKGGHPLTPQKHRGGLNEDYIYLSPLMSGAAMHFALASTGVKVLLN